MSPLCAQEPPYCHLRSTGGNLIRVIHVKIYCCILHFVYGDVCFNLILGFIVVKVEIQGKCEVVSGTLNPVG